MKLPEPGVNPAFDEAQTHVASSRLCFQGGKLHQLWTPADWSAHAPEWRPVESDDAAPAPADPAPGG